MYTNECTFIAHTLFACMIVCQCEHGVTTDLVRATCTTTHCTTLSADSEILPQHSRSKHASITGLETIAFLLNAASPLARFSFTKRVDRKSPLQSFVSENFLNRATCASVACVEHAPSQD